MSCVVRTLQPLRRGFALQCFSFLEVRARDIRKRGGFCAVFIFQIPESFADCLGGLLSVVGQNLSLKLEAVGETLISATHANRPVQWSAANKRYRMCKKNFP